MQMLSAIKKINMDGFTSSWRIGLCDGCSSRFNMFRKKKVCNFCKCAFCNLCVMRRPDRKWSCRKCQILTARPLDREELLNLKSRDLVNYLTSRHISTSGCVEKEDLVNVLIRAVNNSTFHATSVSDTTTVLPSTASSYPSSPHNSPYLTETLGAKRTYTQSVDDLSSHDGIRVRASEVTDTSLEDKEDSLHGFVVVEAVDEVNPSVTVPLPPEVVPDETGVEVAAAVNVEVPVSSVSSASCSTSVTKPLLLSDITSKADLEQLTVKQLKELLIRNRTDYKGCVERAELVERVNRLWCDYVISRKDLEKLSLEELCKICMDAPIECVLLECGHMATCTACGKQLCECPICRQLVVRCVRAFKA